MLGLGGDGIEGAMCGGRVGRVKRGCLFYLPVLFKTVTIYGGADGIVACMPTM